MGTQKHVPHINGMEDLAEQTIGANWPVWTAEHAMPVASECDIPQEQHEKQLPPVRWRDSLWPTTEETRYMVEEAPTALDAR